MTQFPVKTATSCQLKWTWSTIFLNRGTTSSCHRCDQLPIDPGNFKNFHNLPLKLENRQDMLAGTRPKGGCEYCFKIEDAGGFSDRMQQASFPDLTPPELLEDPTAINVTPRILEIYFTNVCNLACLYCGPWFSTKWESEFKKHGKISRDGFEFDDGGNWHPNYEENVALLWEWMRENGKHLREFHILGGEPFFQKEFVDCMDFFEEHPMRDCEFVIITNLMVDDKRMDYYIERFTRLVAKRKLRGVHITASLDCWGPQIEYIRSGLDLAQWKRNFEKLMKLKWVRLQIGHAISGLSIPYMADLYDQIAEWEKERKIFTQFMTVVDPKYMNPDIFDADVFEEDFKRILDKMATAHHYDGPVKEYMEGIGKQIASGPANVPELKNLKIYLEEIDKRRKTDYTVLFPWLVKQFKRYGL